MATGLHYKGKPTPHHFERSHACIEQGNLYHGCDEAARDREEVCGRKIGSRCSRRDLKDLLEIGWRPIGEGVPARRKRRNDSCRTSVSQQAASDAISRADLFHRESAASCWRGIIPTRGMAQDKNAQRIRAGVRQILVFRRRTCPCCPPYASISEQLRALRLATAKGTGAPPPPPQPQPPLPMPMMEH
jgi:hypothetical protein